MVLLFAERVTPLDSGVYESEPRTVECVIIVPIRRGACTIMSAAQVVVEGVLKPDGSLEVTEKFGLPPGRVRVTVEVFNEPIPAGENWFEYLEQARSERELAGAEFRAKEEIDAEIDSIRNDWDCP